MAYPHKWSPIWAISYKTSAGQRKHIGQRPMLYRWSTQPTGVWVNDASAYRRSLSQAAGDSRRFPVTACHLSKVASCNFQHLYCPY